MLTFRTTMADWLNDLIDSWPEDWWERYPTEKRLHRRKRRLEHELLQEELVKAFSKAEEDYVKASDELDICMHLERRLSQEDERKLREDYKKALEDYVKALDEWFRHKKMEHDQEAIQNLEAIRNRIDELEAIRNPVSITNVSGDAHHSTTNDNSTTTNSHNVHINITTDSHNNNSNPDCCHNQCANDIDQGKRRRRWSITKFIHVPIAVPTFFQVMCLPQGFMQWIWDAFSQQWVQSWWAPVVQWFHNTTVPFPYHS
ncbi:hypothetical protein D9758_017039 [Tetrapyrgos nigripes]|uniref:Uncharacterized protein n=1 Tax=Tetrapyrgos nigripes TaxID=182062 RepID=A0A8H5CLA0_9AGAR|nr:hypothetical protein D9758_017039 [Tetrapyrgos nigripes]